MVSRSNVRFNAVFIRVYTEPPLHTAVRSKDIKMVETLLKSGTDVNAVNQWKETPLYLSIVSNEEKIVKLLLEHNADINYRFSDKDDWHLAFIGHKAVRSNTPLLDAVYFGNEAIIKLILDKGADVSGKNERECTILHVAANGKKEQVLKLLLDYSAEIKAQINFKDIYGMTPLYFAAASGCEGVVKVLLDYNAEINCEGANSPLMAGVASGNEATIKLLLDKGADVNVKDIYGWTLLNKAFRKNENVAKLLLTYDGVRAQINSKDIYGETPIYVAVENGWESVVKILLDLNAEINCEGAKSPLMAVVLKGNEEIIKLLLDKGANVNVKDNVGWTLLGKAVIYSEENVIKLLLTHNANILAAINNKDSGGKTPLFWAAYRGSESIVKLFLDYNADINYEDGSIPPLLIAVSFGYESIIKMLLDKGMRWNVKDEFGYSALHKAVFVKKEKVLKFLLEYAADKHAKENKEVDVDLEDNFGKTPLYYAAQQKNNKGFNCLKPLLEFNADSNYKSNHEFTPFQIAVINNNERAVATLLDWMDINLIFNNKIEHPNYFSFSCSEDIKKVLEQHIIKLKVVGLYLNKHLHELSNIYEEPDYEKKCEEEVKRLKQQIPDTSISFHDILLNRISKDDHNNYKNNIALVFESIGYETDFPIYASMIESQYRKDIQRQKLLEETSPSFSTLTSILPDACIDKIKSYFSINDLKKLKNAR